MKRRIASSRTSPPHGVAVMSRVARLAGAIGLVWVLEVVAGTDVDPPRDDRGALVASSAEGAGDRSGAGVARSLDRAVEPADARRRAVGPAQSAASGPTAVAGAAVDHVAIARDARGREVSAEEVPGATLVDTEAAWRLFRAGVTFVDVRLRADYETARIPGAVHLPIMETPDHPDNRFTAARLLDVVGGHHAPVVLYCNAALCWRTEAATRLAVAWGFTDVRYFRDGFPAWRRAGLPVE